MEPRGGVGAGRGRAGAGAVAARLAPRPGPPGARTPAETTRSVVEGPSRRRAAAEGASTHAQRARAHPLRPRSRCAPAGPAAAALRREARRRPETIARSIPGRTGKSCRLRCGAGRAGARGGAGRARARAAHTAAPLIAPAAASDGRRGRPCAGPHAPRAAAPGPPPAHARRRPPRAAPRRPAAAAAPRSARARADWRALTCVDWPPPHPTRAGG